MQLALLKSSIPPTVRQRNDRNVTIFNALRHYAYSTVNYHRSKDSGSPDAFHQHLRQVCTDINGCQLPACEEASIAKSIANWTWRLYKGGRTGRKYHDMTTKEQSELQSWLGSRGAKVSADRRGKAADRRRGAINAIRRKHSAYTTAELLEAYNAFAAEDSAEGFKVITLRTLQRDLAELDKPKVFEVEEKPASKEKPQTRSDDIRPPNQCEAPAEGASTDANFNVEVDLVAAFPQLIHALMGVPLLQPDRFYDIDGFDRDKLKESVSQMLSVDRRLRKFSWMFARPEALELRDRYPVFDRWLKSNPLENNLGRIRAELGALMGGVAANLDRLNIQNKPTLDSIRVVGMADAPVAESLLRSAWQTRFGFDCSIKLKQK